ncbi:FAD-dependent oxidoreductase [Sporosarcina sp. ACRSM]|uniref:flavin monoamine oxidase family protein n=1 Tax=Sporosarcina sp. ACRSM TaxID=2918216 RepID=UPI001EF71EDD|nr:NAD(P)/FAD-dependent oxidoreductase [Sporosarcina sp. ACRSM]MCG7333676.1 FAD-dependent oxidoreductase [Sporosarcina sp. ACRSM]
MSIKNYDVIIIGAGFAGVTAARELSQKGYQTLVLEARDRLGGRTWVDKQLGRNLEMGGTWVHWFQPHIWAEISRYGLEVVPSPDPEKAYWVADGKRHEGTVEELFGMLDEANNQLLADARKYFPLPYEPLTSKKLNEVDHLTVSDKIDSLGLNDNIKELMHSMWALNFNGPTERAGLTQAMRWAALSDYNWQLMMEICASYKIEKGTGALIEGIMNDAKADVFYSEEVSLVEKTASGFVVSTKGGGQFIGRTVINTLPLNVLNSIEYRPALSPVKFAAAEEGQTSRGIKFWARVKNITTPFIAFAPEDYPINYIQLEYTDDQDGILVGFGPDASKLDPTNKLEVERALRRVIPDIHVVESIGHDWVGDPLSGETWPMQCNNQLTNYLSELQKPKDGLFLAGSDYADGWAGFIDGAIESAFKVSRKVEQYLEEKVRERAVI